jgi:hypothetical protein
MHVTAHSTAMPYLGAGLAVPQSDTYMIVATL